MIDCLTTQQSGPYYRADACPNNPLPVSRLSTASRTGPL